MIKGKTRSVKTPSSARENRRFLSSRSFGMSPDDEEAAPSAGMLCSVRDRLTPWFCDPIGNVRWIRISWPSSVTMGHPSTSLESWPQVAHA